MPCRNGGRAFQNRLIRADSHGPVQGGALTKFARQPLDFRLNSKVFRDGENHPFNITERVPLVGGRFAFGAHYDFRWSVCGCVF